MELHERVARLEERVTALAAQVSELDHEGTERSRSRLHRLEQDIAARKAAEAAVHALNATLAARRTALYAKLGIGVSAGTLIATAVEHFLR